MAPCKEWENVLNQTVPTSVFFLREPITCCDVCRAIMSLGKGDPRWECKDGMSIWVEAHGTPRFVEVFPFDPSGEANWRLRIFAQDDTPCPWGIFPSASAEDPLCESSRYDKAVRMIETCSSEHSCVSPELPRLPTRVIHVGRSSDDVRLVETHGARARYICLSHCWGGCQPLTTTRNTLEQLLDRLPWDQVPQMYRDFIDTSRRLGAEYVWIDSLCIIQDDADDWARESHKMCDVYENAWLTIAATSIPNCKHELWKASALPATKNITTGHTDAGAPFRLLAVPVPAWHPTNVDQPSHLRQFWPLLDRAWVFQEIMLSPRVLHFSKWELLWECKARTHCECGRLEPRSKDSRFERVFATGDTDSLWREMVQGFSRLSLTVAGDKFVSLAGLAQKFARKRPRETYYLAGLWRDSIVRDLMWYNIAAVPYYKHNADHDAAPCLGRAPSWSWMKMTSQVMFADSPSRFPSPVNDTRSFFDRVYFVVEHATCELGDAAYPMGPVKSGLLRVRCRVFDAVLKIAWFPPGTRTVFSVPVDGTPTLMLGLLFGDANNTATNGGRRTNSIGFATRNVGWGTLCYLDSPTDPLCGHGALGKANDEVKCAPMARVRRTWEYMGKIIWEVDEWLMVLLPTGNRDEFVRIGMALMRKMYDDETKAVEAACSPVWSEMGRGEVVVSVV